MNSYKGGKQSSPSQHSFARAPTAEIQRSTFDMSQGFKTTFDSGYLVPIYVDEVLPGDTFRVNMTAFARLATPLHPFMDNLHMSTFFFFVPNRLLWDNWERFNGAQDNPGDSTDFLIPQIVAPAVTGYTVGTISDYMGLPTEVPDFTHSALWHRAYNRIFNDWFKDQNLQDQVVQHTDNGPDPETDYVLLRRGKRHDYFTSCLPWAQKGDPVQLPLGDKAPITGLGATTQTWNAGPTSVYESGDTGSVSYASHKDFDHSTANQKVLLEEDPDNAGFPNLFVDLAEATGATVNALREAFAIQKMLERDARSGTRYTEMILAHFKVKTPDARLQRTEYLGGGSTPILIQTLAQTSNSGSDIQTSDTPLATVAGVGTANLTNHGFTSSFTEHGVIIGLVNVRADLTYQTGLDRMWSRSTRLDFYLPALSHIGEQAVLNKEIHLQNDPADELVFGYQERWGEMRYGRSKITGQFRSTFGQSLDTWHLAQDFAALPTLSADFIEDTPPVSRVIAVQTEPEFLFDAYFSIKTARPMPIFGVPGMIDRF